MSAQESARQSLQAQQVAGATAAIVKDGDVFRQLLTQSFEKITEASLRKVPPEFIMSEVLAVLRTNPKLRECDPNTILHGALMAVQCGLSLNPVMREAFLIPRKGKAEFQLGYRGIVKRARRHPQLKNVGAEIVRESDEFTFTHGANPTLTHSWSPKLSEKERGAAIGCYGYFHTVNGGFQFEYWNIEDLKAFGAEFKSNKTGNGLDVWRDDPEAMYKKTMVIQVLKFAPSDDLMLQSLLQVDELERRGLDQGISIRDGRVVSASIDEAEAAVVMVDPAAPKEIAPAPDPKIMFNNLLARVDKFEQNEGGKAVARGWIKGVEADMQSGIIKLSKEEFDAIRNRLNDRFSIKPKAQPEAAPAAAASPAPTTEVAPEIAQKIAEFEASIRETKTHAKLMQTISKIHKASDELGAAAANLIEQANARVLELKAAKSEKSGGKKS